MTNRVLGVICAILFIILLVLIFLAGYERGVSKAEVKSHNKEIIIHKDTGVVQTNSTNTEAKLKDPKVLPGQMSETYKDVTIASSLLDSDSNELTDEINFEFNKSTPLIVASGVSEKITIDSLAEDAVNSDTGPHINDLYNIKSEFFVFVGLFDEPTAVQTIEFVQKMGFPAKIHFIKYGETKGAAVIAGPMLLSDDAERLKKILIKNGYKEAQVIE